MLFYITLLSLVVKGQSGTCAVMSPSAEGANIAGWTGLATTQVIGNTNCLRTDGNVDSPCLEIVRVLNCDKCKLLTIDYENCKSEWAFNKMTV